MKNRCFLSSKSVAHAALTLCLSSSMLSLVSCAGFSEVNESVCLPFKSSENGKWGLIGTDGIVLFEEEFKDMPTSAKNGRFMIENGNGLWEIYTAEAKPEKIGEEYLQVADFTESTTPSVKKNERICLIDKNGKVIATLDKINNKNVISCSQFRYGYATVITEDDLQGIINTKGKVVIKPKFSHVTPIANGVFVALDKTTNDYEESRTLRILDTSEKQIMKLQIGSDHKYIDFDAEASTSKYLAVCTSTDGERRWGYIDYSNNVVVKPTDKIKSIGEVKNDNFIFFNGENYGVMNFEGETILRAKYDMLTWADDNLLIAYDSDTRYSLINLSGEKLTNDYYQNILPFYGGSCAPVRVSDNGWELINKNGEEVNIKNSPDIYYICNNSACQTVRSDYVDMDAIIAQLHISKNGLMGYGLNMSPLQIAKAYNEIEGDGERCGLNPNENERRDKLTKTFSSAGIDISSMVYYEQYMTEYSNNNVVWSKEKPAYINVYVSGSSISNKADLLYSKIIASVKPYGKVIGENNRATIVKLAENKGWVITNEGDGVKILLTNSNLNEYTYQLSQDGTKSVPIVEEWVDSSYDTDYNTYRRNGSSHVVLDGVNVRLRLAPSLDSEVYHNAKGNIHLPKGTALPYVGTANDEFFAVQYGGMTLFVSKQFSHLE